MRSEVILCSTDCPRDLVSNFSLGRLQRHRGFVYAILFMIAVYSESSVADIWGYVDESGVAHLSDHRVNEKYKFFRKEPTRPSKEVWRPPLAQHANDKAILRQIAENYAGKFASEVKDEKFFEREFRLRVRVKDFAAMENLEDSLALSEIKYVLFNFDDAKQRISFDTTLLGLVHFVVHRTCNTTGVGVGRTAMGLTVNYTKKSCDSISIFHRSHSDRGDRIWCQDSANTESSDLVYGCRRSEVRFPASAAAFRAIARQGLEAELLFKLHRRTDGPIVEFRTDISNPSLRFPLEFSNRDRTIYGEIFQVAWFAVGASEPLPLE